MREISFRYIIMRNGADYGEIFPIQGASLRMDGNANIKTSLSGEFADPGDAVNWLTDEIRPEMVIDGITHRLGIFLPTTVENEENETTKSVKVEAYDRCWLVENNYTETSKYFASGVNYIDAVESLLTACGIALISAVPTTATLAEAREDWNIGTSYLEIVNQLLSEINYNPLWFDKDGLAILEPASQPSAENIDHVLDMEDIGSLMYPTLNRKTDVFSSPNVFICVCSNADKSGPLVARSENTNPQSPLSIPRRGRRIATVVNVNNIASLTELQAYADRIRNESMITGETISVSTGLLQGYGVGDVTALKYNDSVFAVCAERSWTMDLQTGGVMQHTLEKVVVNLG